MAISLEAVSIDPTRPVARRACICAWCGGAVSGGRLPKAAPAELNYGMCGVCLAAALERLGADESGGKPRCAVAS